MATRARKRTAAQIQTEAELRDAYVRCFKSPNGRLVLEDLIERFDPPYLQPPPNGDAAIWTTAVRRVLSHIREMTGEVYAHAMARADGRE